MTYILNIFVQNTMVGMASQGKKNWKKYTEKKEKEEGKRKKEKITKKNRGKMPFNRIFFGYKPSTF